MRYTIPNTLTMARVVCVPVLWLLAIARANLPFVILLALAGLSDVFDGYFARRLRQQSGFGAWFDSFADNIVSASIPFWLFFLLPDFVLANLVVLVAIIVLFVISIMLGIWRYGRIVSYHLYSNKIANLVLYLFVLEAVLVGPSRVFFAVTVFILAIALIEEMAVTLTRKHPPTNLPWFFAR
jgi:phosphatidylglycerophosphate synthase